MQMNFQVIVAAVREESQKLRLQFSKCEPFKQKKYSSYLPKLKQQNHILMYELAVCHKALQLLSEYPQINATKQISELQIECCTLTEQNKKLQKQLSKQITLRIQVQTTKATKVAQIAQLSKDLNRCKKIIINLERLSQKQNRKLNDCTCVEYQSRQNQFIAEKERLLTKNKELENRCSILKTLNQETEEKLSSVMVKENDSGNSNKDKKGGNLQIYALKHKNKELKQKVKSLQQQKEAMKCNLEGKEAFYRKMINCNL